MHVSGKLLGSFDSVFILLSIGLFIVKADFSFLHLSL